MVSPFRGDGPFRGRGPFLGRSPWARKGPWGETLGPELVTNGTFDSVTTGWTANVTTQSVVSGEIEVVSTSGAANARTRQAITTIVGRTYLVTGVMRAKASNSVAASARIASSPSDFQAFPVLTNGVDQSISIRFVASATLTSIDLQVASGSAWGAAGDTAYFDNISVREVLWP
jgi:hypothetical protein